MKEKNTREKGIDLVRKELERRKFNVTPTPKRNSPGDLTVATEFTEKTVRVRAHRIRKTNDGKGYDIDPNSKEAAVEKAQEVDFCVFVLLDDNDKIIESFVWHCGDDDLIEERGKWGLFPFRKTPQTKGGENRQGIFDKWQKRKDEFGWKLIESLMAAGKMNSSNNQKADAELSSDIDDMPEGEERERIVAEADAELPPDINDMPKGEERERIVRERRNQYLFRRNVLSAYGGKCCITGLNVPELLNASHIVPWSKNPEQRLNPRNGLCLNALHDRAFDRGLITVLPNGKVKVSAYLREKAKTCCESAFLTGCDGKKIAEPDKHEFKPATEFLEHHNQKIFHG